MDPAKKRKTRLIVTLGIALLLATALVYTSFSASTVARTPAQLLASSVPGESYELSGRVVSGSVKKSTETMTFAMRDRAAGGSAKAIHVKYSGTVPDPFREGREVIVTGKVVDGTFVAEPNSLITKCPSKYTSADASQANGKPSKY